MCESLPLVSSQRYLNHALVQRKAATFKVFIVRVMEVEMRGRRYEVLLDGHHNLAAARLVGAAPAWRGPSAKIRRVLREMGEAAFRRMLVNNLTDSDWYYVDTGEVVQELLGIEREAA